MSDVAVRMEHVYKKFRKGEIFNSLRDFLPALTGKMFRQSELNQSDKREFWALQDLSFEVKSGECFGIVGHNGAGKSTALKILSRIMKPTKGQVVINGRLSALIEVSAGFHQDLTGRENIFLNGTILGMSRREIQKKMDQIIAFSGIEDFIDTPVKRYSSGMYARLGFSVASHVNPDVLIVDEVLSVGDYAFQQKCIDRMREVLRSGAAVLFVSHNLKIISEFCTRCLLLEQGRTALVGSAPEVVSAYLQNTRGSRSSRDSAQEVFISKVQVRNEFGECRRFRAGEKAWVEVELTARVACAKISVELYATNEAGEILFETSTVRLGSSAITLEADDIFTCVFEVYWNLTSGIYHPSITLYRHETQTVFDEWMPASTIYISSEQDIRGSVHCFPKVIRQELRPRDEHVISGQGKVSSKLQK